MILPVRSSIHHQFTDAQLETLAYLSTICCSFSLILSFFLIINFIRRNCFIRKYLASRLIFYISISEFLVAAARLMIWFDYEKSSKNPVCLIQAYLINFSQLSSVFWSLVVCWVLYKTLIFNDLLIKSKEPIFLLCCYGFPVIYAMIPIFTGSYGPTEVWCWLNYDNINFENVFIKVLELYLPIVIVFIINSSILCKIGRFLNEHEEIFPKNIVNKLKAYAICLLFIWITVVIHRIYSYIDDRSIFLFTITIINNTLMNLTGCINYMVYGYESSYLNSCITALKKRLNKGDSVEITPSANEEENDQKSHYTIDSFGDPTRRTLLYNNFSEDF